MNMIVTSRAGLVSKRQGEVEKEHHAPGEQPNGDRFHVEPESEHAVRSGPHQGTHAGLAGSKLCRSVLTRARNVRH